MKSSLPLMTIVLLSGCGGGGATGTGTPSGVPNQSIGGIWRGQVTTASGAVLQTVMMVSDDGRFISSAQDSTNHCADVAQGSFSTSGATVSGAGGFGRINYMTVPATQTDCSFADGSLGGTTTLSGSVAQGSSLTVTSANTTSTGTALAGVPAVLAYDKLYNQSSDLTKTAGTWTAQTGAIFIIDSGGIISATDPQTGCSVNGQMSVINPVYDVYSITVTYSNCQQNSTDLNGITALGLLALDNTVTPNVLDIGYVMTLPSGDSLIFATVASR